MYWRDLKNDARVDSTRLILAFAWLEMPFRHCFRRLIVHSHADRADDSNIGWLAIHTHIERKYDCHF